MATQGSEGNDKYVVTPSDRSINNDDVSMLTEVTNISDDDTIKTGSVNSNKEWREMRSIQKMLDQHGFSKKMFDEWKSSHPSELNIIEKTHSSKYKQTGAIIVSMAIDKMKTKETPNQMEEELAQEAPENT